MKRKKGTLRQNAAQAKARLITGFWNERHEKASLKNINNANCEEEQLYSRVAGYLQQGANPLSSILDQSFMANLDDAARQRYVLTMSSLVQKSIERYNRVS